MTQHTPSSEPKIGTLYDYWRSTAGWRVRIGLHLKGLGANREAVDLRPTVSGQLTPEYRAISVQGRVPLWVQTSEDKQPPELGQSMAILDWLEETYPEPSLLPQKAWARAQSRSIAFMIASDIHPLNNIGVLGQLRARFDANDEQIEGWYHHWLRAGLDAVEEKLARLDYRSGWVFDDRPSLAEICIIPQLYNARRFHFALDAYARLRAIETHAMTHAAFHETAPDQQSDAQV